jgi:hypothetical protein
MKKLFLLATAILFTSAAYAQQWSGSSTTTGNLHRSGNVGIGYAGSDPVYQNLHIKGTAGSSGIRLEAPHVYGSLHNHLEIVSNAGEPKTVAQSFMFRVGNSSSATTNPSSWTTIGYLSINGFFASRFYDINNTSYFIDPSVSGNSTSIRVAGTIIGTRLLDENNNAYFIDPSISGDNTSIRVAGTIRGTRFQDENNTAYFIDPSVSGNSTSISVAGTIVGTRLLDANNTAYYVDPSYTGTSISVAGTIRGTVFRDASNTAYYLDPSSTATSINVNGLVLARSIH